MEQIIEQSSQVNTVYVKTLGDFSITCNGATLKLSGGRNTKLWKLLEYLVVHHTKGFSPEQIMQAIWPREEYDNPLNTLKNLIYRLRTLLAESELPPQEYIVARRGGYCWNPEIPCIIDAEELELNWKEATDVTLEEHIRKNCYLRAIDLYQGVFLPQSQHEEWVIPLATYYQRLYGECISGVFEILSKYQQYETIVNICNAAIILDPYDESLFCMLITALVALDRKKEALQAYDNISRALYQELEAEPSEELHTVYRNIMKTIQSVETDFDIIKKELGESKSRKGAFLCDYQTFKDIYRFVARGVSRTGQSVYILLFTLTDPQDGAPDVQYLGDAMNRLENIVRNSLRKGDLFARYSSLQYVILLPSANYENGCMVANRIINGFYRGLRHQSIRLHFKLNPLDPNVE